MFQVPGAIPGFIFAANEYESVRSDIGIEANKCHLRSLDIESHRLSVL